MSDPQSPAIPKPSSFGIPEGQRSHLKHLLAAAISERLDVQRRQHELACQEAELGRKIDLLLSLMPPFSKLPRELQQEIFLECLPKDRLPILNSNEPPLVLGRVCRAWREVAMSTPQLWASVHIAVPLQRHTAQGNIVAQRLQSYMDRAQRLPMDLSLWSSTTDHEPYDAESCGAIVRCLQHNSSRIANLEIDVSDGILRNLAAIEGNHTWDVLESITLHCDPTNQYDRGRGFDAHNLSFWSSMALRSVTLLSVQDNLLRFPIHWERLTELLITDAAEVPDEADASHGDGTRWLLLTAYEARALLSLCPNLVNLRMDLGERARPLPGTPPSFHAVGASAPLTHSNLATLQLNDIVFGGGTSSFLDGLQLPSLKHLSYFVCVAGDLPLDQIPDIVDHPLHSFLESQSHPSSITKLTVWKYAFTADALVSCLKLMPALEELWIKDATRTRHALKDVFLGMFLPISMRRHTGEAQSIVGNDGIEHSEPIPSVSQRVAERSKPPICGLCPRLHSMRIDEADFTHEAIMHFALSRMDLSNSVLAGTAGEPQTVQYARLRRLRLRLSGMNPDYAACDARGAANETEDCLWRVAGVDARIIMQRPRSDSRWMGRAMRLQEAYDPGRGLPPQGVVEVNDGWSYV